MFDSQKNQFLGADASGAQAQSLNTSPKSWLQVLSDQQDSNSQGSGQTTTPSLADDALTRDWKSTMKSNYTASLADGDPLDGVAEAKLVAMRANNSATESGGAGAGNASVATDAGGGPGQKWNRDAAIQHLEKYAGIQSQHNCAGFVGRAIEAGGIRLNRALNSAGKSACGYGPILKDAGFKTVPEGTPPQAGDVVIFPKSPGYPDGHAAMYSGGQWISDFKQKIMYASKKAEEQKIPYTIYSRP